MITLVTLSEMKAELGLTDTTDDAVLTGLITRLEGRFDDHCRRAFAREAAVVEYFDGGQFSLYLRHWPIESVASVHISADQEWTDETLLPATDYRIYTERGRIGYCRGAIAWPAGVRNIRAIYTGGYAAPGVTPPAGEFAVPEALRGLFVMQCAYEFRNRLHLGEQSVSAQGASVSMAPADFLPAVKAGLIPYMRL